MSVFLKRAWAEIDLDAIKHNYKQIRSRIGNSKLMCVIKADAYGHGAVMLAKEYEKLGADFFAVSNLEEALQLRNNDITLPILILGYTPECEVKSLSENNISQAVFSFDYALALSEQAVKCGVDIKIHLKLDTGMTRIGLLCQNKEQADESFVEAVKICSMDNLIPEGLFTHFALADDGESGEEYTQKQLECFNYLSSKLENNGIKFTYRHCANSAAIADYPQAHMDMVRAGIILYGLASPNVRNKLDLRPAMKVKAVVSHIKEVPRNTNVSYGCTYTTDKSTVLATVPIGYADGYNRLLGNRGYISVNGKKALIAGRVCMDQLMADITDIPNVKRGDTVTVFGDDVVSCDDLAKLCGTINYEIVCLVGKRVPRVYIKDGKICETTGLLQNL
ncbi:MAG: alanine racemase [Clostridiales bacterium]|nr:alanine racemase [Clostridiales bacterium]